MPFTWHPCCCSVIISPFKMELPWSVSLSSTCCVGCFNHLRFPEFSQKPLLGSSNTKTPFKHWQESVQICCNKLSSLTNTSRVIRKTSSPNCSLQNVSQWPVARWITSNNYYHNSSSCRARETRRSKPSPMAPYPAPGPGKAFEQWKKYLM